MRISDVVRIVPLEARHLYLWAAVSVTGGALVLSGVFAGTQSVFSDALFVPSTPSEDIVLVKIDDRSLNEIGQWPWPRAVFADALDVLGTAAVVGIDVSFREPSRTGAADDVALRMAFSHATTTVVFAAAEPMSETERSFAVYASHGFSGLPADSDGTVRQLLIQRDAASSFAYTVVTHAGGGLPEHIVETKPLVRINYRGANGTYPAVSFVDLLENPALATAFEGKVVLVGVTASDLQNFHHTPFGFMSGIEIQANAVDTLLSRVFYVESDVATVAAITVLSFLAIVASVAVRRLWQMLLILLGITALYVFIALIAFSQFVILDLLYPLSALVVSALLAGFSQLIAVSERERAVRESFGYLAAMVESLEDGVILTDPQGRVRVLNAAARRLLGASDRTEGALLQDYTAQLPAHIDLSAQLNRSIAQRTFITSEDVLYKDRYMQLLTGPVSARGGAQMPVIGGVIIIHDITQQKEIERIREDFISMMVHELRSPLDAIKKLSEALARPSVRDDRRRSYIDLVHTNAADMLVLVNDLLDVAKIEAGKFEIRPKPTDIRSLINSRKEFFQEVARSQRISLSAVVDEAVPRYVTLDATRMGQVLNNLLSNALKFTTRGGSVSLHVYTLTRGQSLAAVSESKGVSVYEHVYQPLPQKAPRPMLVLAVSDTGPGMSPEDLAALFNKFTQFEQRTKSDQQGTGLGLAIVKGITEAHGGTVAATSRVGVGTVFYILIPLTESVTATEE